MRALGRLLRRGERRRLRVLALEEREKVVSQLLLSHQRRLTALETTVAAMDQPSAPQASQAAPPSSPVTEPGEGERSG